MTTSSRSTGGIAAHYCSADLTASSEASASAGFWLFAEGVAAYLSKPIDVKEFLAVLERVMGPASGEEGPA